MTGDIGQAFNTFIEENYILYKGCLIGIESDGWYSAGGRWFLGLDRAKIEVDRNLKTLGNSVDK